MRWMFMLGACWLPIGTALADDPAVEVIKQFQQADDESEKAELAVQLNRAVSRSPVIRPQVAAVLRKALDSAQSLELVSILAHSWWMHEERSAPLTPETTQLVFRLLDDVRRHENRRSTPTTPRERAITILSTCEESVVPRVVALLHHERAMHRAAGISILASRGYFNAEFEQLEPFFESPEEIVQRAVAQACKLNEAHRDEAVSACFRMMDSIKPGRAYDELAMAAAAQAKHLGPEKAWHIQQQLLNRLQAKVYQSQLQRAIAITMGSLSDEHQRAAVKRIAFRLHDHWLETAVLAAGPNGRLALGHFVRRFKEANEKTRLRRAYNLYRIERDADRVFALFVEGLDADTATQRYYAFAGIRAMGPDAEAAVPVLIQKLKSRNTTVVRQSLEALAAIRTSSPEALHAVQSISSTNPSVISSAKETIAILTEPAIVNPNTNR